jgi:ribosomal protein L40E
MLCAKCQSDNLPDAAFCTECGAKLEAMCASCGLSNPPGSKFCRKCGSRLSTIDPTAPGSRYKDDSVLLPASAMADVAEGERKMVTALFADIKGSMELMEDLDPEEARPS